MPSLGLGVSIPRQWALITRPVDTEFITFTSPKDKYVYFSKCISGHIGVDYTIDLIAQRNMVYFGRCITGTREVTDAIRGN